MKADLFRLGTAALLAEGRRAHAAGDIPTLRACLRELGYRSSRAAGEAEEVLRGLLRDASSAAGRRRPPELEATVDATRIEVLTDSDIVQRRIKMIERAERSVWISSLTFPSGELVDALVSRAPHLDAVTLIVAERTVSHRHAEARARLRRAGVEYRPLPSTHSKLLVIDEKLVMVGSANADRVHRDVCIVFRDQAKAKELIEYMVGLAEA